MNNTYLEETSSGTQTLSLDSKLFSERKLFLEGEITPQTVSDFTRAMLYLTQSDEPINIYINSPGGNVNSGLAIYDIIQGCKNEINICCVGMAFSMAAVILAGGQPGRRFILPHSQVMIHEAMLGGEFGGTAVAVRNLAERLNNTQNQLNAILSLHTGRTLEEIIRDSSFDNFMNAEKAVKLGFCDWIIRNVCDIREVQYA